MKKFEFRLQTVLEHREMLESLREQEFSAAQGRFAIARDRLDTLNTHYQETVSARPGSGRGEKFDAQGIQSRERYIEAIQAQIAEQEQQVEIARIIAEEMRLQMVKARQAREVVSQLRDKDYEEYMAETQKQAQNRMDEIATTQYVRAQNEENRQSSAANALETQFKFSAVK